MADVTEKPVSYAARTLSKAERNYSQMEKQALAITCTVKKFHQYLYGQHFVLLTDHKPLLGLLSEEKAIPSMAAAQIQRWAIILSAYNYFHKYGPSSQNSNANFFSRYPLKNTNQESPKLTNQVLLMEFLHSPVASKESSFSSQRDSVLSKVTEYVLTSGPDSISEQLKPYHYCRNELSMENICLLWRNRVVLPLNLQRKVLGELHDNHAGINRMKALARLYVWWPLMDTHIEQSVKSCKSCQLYQTMPAKAPLHPLETSEAPWIRIHLYFSEPFLTKCF